MSTDARAAIAEALAAIEAALHAVRAALDEPKAAPPPSPPSSTDDLLTVRQVAQLLRVDVTQVYRLLAAGRLRGLRVGERAWRVRRRDLDAFLAGYDAVGSGAAVGVLRRRRGRPRRA